VYRIRFLRKGCRVWRAGKNVLSSILHCLHMPMLPLRMQTCSYQRPHPSDGWLCVVGDYSLYFFAHSTEVFSCVDFDLHACLMFMLFNGCTCYK